MIFTIIIPIVLFTLIVIFDATKDVLKDRYDGSFFDKHPKMFPRSYWEPSISWKNKWVLDENGVIKTDAKGMRIHKKMFWGLSFPDAFSDGWHFVKFFLWTALILVTAINLPLFVWYINFVILSALYLTVWTIFYDHLLRHEI